MSEAITASNVAPQSPTRTDADVQKRLNLNEQNVRQSLAISASNFMLENQIMPKPPPPISNAKPLKDPAVPREVIRTTRQDTNLELMNPIWLDNDLFLIRRVSVGKQEYIQGCWLDWPGIRKILMELVEDLLPRSNLVPVVNQPLTGQTRLLASIPALLIPGSIPEAPQERWSILHISLGIAWMGVLLATGAVAIVLRRTLELNQRRGAFVSAVTHELRTPLTTFRLYTEMLDEGMVTDSEKQKKYFSTLHGESERLSHLVENVLMYAQLENNRGGVERIEIINLADLKERLAPSLSERATQSGMTLTIEIDQQAYSAAVRVDASAVERILFNLVDNAGKYGRTDHNPGIALSFTIKGKLAALSVSDHGSGIAPRQRKKLFKPFSKSASEAANSAPGIGLGLSISKGLARRMRGDLAYDASYHGGARFIFTLPLVYPEHSRYQETAQSPR
jgi:signal transduction histidine kinase